MQQSTQDPKVWGPKYWFVMKSVAKHYPVLNPPKNVVNEAIAFYNSLVFLLPCQDCSKHYSDLLKKYPVKNYIHSRVSLVNWVNQIERSIQEIIRKEENIAKTKENIKKGAMMPRLVRKNITQSQKMPRRGQRRRVPVIPAATRKKMAENVKNTRYTRNTRNTQQTGFVRGHNYVRPIVTPKKDCNCGKK